LDGGSVRPFSGKLPPTMSTQNNTPTKNIFDNLSDMSDDEEITHYRVFDATWDYDIKHDSFGDYWDNHENFDTLEEAMEVYENRCDEYADGGAMIESVYLEAMGGGMDDYFQIDTVEYWERCTQDEFKASELKKKQKKKHKKKPPLRLKDDGDGVTGGRGGFPLSYAKKYYYKVSDARNPDVEYFDTLVKAKAFCDRHASGLGLRKWGGYGMIMKCDSDKNEIGNYGDY